MGEAATGSAAICGSGANADHISGRARIALVGAATALAALTVELVRQLAYTITLIELLLTVFILGVALFVSVAVNASFSGISMKCST